jgi:hypothetical protein
VPNSEIDHLTYPVLLETYNSDPTLDRALKTFFIRELKNKFAMRQWETYKLTATPGVRWMAMAFSDKIEHIHNLHEKWLDDQEEMCHKEHKYWSEVYAKDPFLSTDKKQMLTYTADRKFLWLIHELPSREYNLFARQNYQYWQNLPYIPEEKE